MCPHLACNIAVHITLGRTATASRRLTSEDDPDKRHDARRVPCVLQRLAASVSAALHEAAIEAAPELEARLKWGHIVYFLNGPVLLVRVEPNRVLFGFWRGQRLRHIEPRLRGGGKYEMATLEIKQETVLLRETALSLAKEAAKLDQMQRAQGQSN